MSINTSKPSQFHCRPRSQNALAVDSDSHEISQQSHAVEFMSDHDNVAMTSAEAGEHVNDEYSEGNHQQDQEQQELELEQQLELELGMDMEQEDTQEQEGHQHYGVLAEVHPGPGAFDGPYHHILYLATAGPPTGTYLPGESDALEEDNDPIAPINYLSIANILTNDIDMEEAFDQASDFAAFHEYVQNYPNPAAGYVESLVFGTHPAAPLGNDFGDATPPQIASMEVQNDDEVQQQLDQLGPGDEFDDGSTVWFPVPAPPAFVSPNMSNLHPANYGLVEFLQQWSFTGARKSKGHGRFPWPQRVAELAQTQFREVHYDDLEPEKCDIQGIDWDSLRVTRRDARERRRLTYRNYTNKEGSDITDAPLQMGAKESFFRFRRMDMRRNTHLSHFQLRNVLASTSRTQMFYTGSGVVHEFNPLSRESKTVIRLPEAPHSQISTLAADHGVLVAGGFNGEYMLRRVDSGGDDNSSSCEGILTSHQSGITNHVQVYLARQSSTPRAAFASNDQVVRVLDVETKTCVSEEAFAVPINCTAISPDRRLRVMVGDSNKVLVTAAESTLGSGRPEILHQLEGHRDFGFACDWADDGWTVATGFQDRLVNIWDARRWTDSRGRATPVETLRTEMAGVRSLHFSPVGSGKRVLVAVEEADFVNIIDAQMFRSKQTVDIFGEIGGATFTNHGQDLVVLCTDRARGGLIQLERCGLGAEASWDPDEVLASLPSRELVRQRGRTFDWPENYHNEWKVVRESATKRRRKAALLDDLEPF